jgi:hypothetical protein
LKKSTSVYNVPRWIILKNAQTKCEIQSKNLPTRASETEAVGQISLDCIPEFLLLLLWDEFRLIVVSLELLVGTADILPIGGALCAATAAATFAAAISLHKRHRLVEGTPHLGQIEAHAHLFAASFAHCACKFARVAVKSPSPKKRRIERRII